MTGVIGARGRDAAPPSAQDGSTRRLLTVLIVAVIGFAIQQTSIVPAVETVQHALGASSEWSAWLVTVYLIVATVATPAMGRLGDLYGRRRLLLVGLAVFVVGSIGASLAPNMATLICFRAIQGIGGAVYPLCLALVREHLPQQRVTQAVGLLTSAFGIGTAIGFVGGGVLAEYASWRWIFAGGAVVVAAATVLVYLVVPDSERRATGGYDRTGTVVLTVSVIALLTALTLVVPLGWRSPVTIGLLVVAVGAALVWLRIELRRPDPLVDVHVLQQPQVAVANLATIGLGWALFSAYLLVPRFAGSSPSRDGFGFAAGPATVGLVLLPLAIAQTASGAAGGWLSARLGGRAIFATGLVLVTAALGLLCLIQGSPVLTALTALLLGAGAGLALETSSAVATQGVADDVAAVSSAVNSTVRRLAGGIGGQVSTILLASLTLGSAATPSRGAYVAGFLVAAVLSLAGALLVAAPVGRTG